MKKQKTQFVIVVIMLVLLCGGYAAIRFYNNKQDEKQQAADEAAKVYVTQFKKEEINEIQYVFEDSEYHFIKEGDVWKNKADEEKNYIQTYLESMASAAAELAAEQRVEDTGNLAQFGFDEPYMTIEIKTEEESAAFTIGEYNGILGCYYLQDEDGNVYLVGESFVTDFSHRAEEMEETEEE